MNRRLWGTVGAVIAGMAAVSIALRSPEQLDRLTVSTGTALAAAERALGVLSWPVIGAVAAALTLAATTIVLVRRRRAATRGGFAEPWRTVIEMGRQGRNPATIAQATGLPQDAVRIILAPVAMEPSFPEGNSFRSSQSNRTGQGGRRRPNPYD